MTGLSAKQLGFGLETEWNFIHVGKFLLNAALNGLETKPQATSQSNNKISTVKLKYIKLAPLFLEINLCKLTLQ